MRVSFAVHSSTRPIVALSRRSTGTAALAAVLAIGAAHAQDPEELRLKIERQLHMAPTRPERDSAKFLEADRIDTAGNKDVVATGNVILRQRGVSIRADRLEYYDDDQKAVAIGNVKIDRDGDTASGPHAEYHLDDDSGDMTSPVFEFPKKDDRHIATRASAEHAYLEDERKSRLVNAEYTSCPVPRNDWVLRVSELDIDGGRNVGSAQHATVYYLGLPIMYMPFLTFPLDTKRKSGFLAPTLGTSGQSGFEVSVPYYWYIADNIDATVTPKLFTKRGVQLGGEFRYLEPKFTGQLDGEFLPHDRIAEIDRYFLGLHHVQRLWSGWSASVNAQKVSDDNYFRDLTTKIALTSQTNLPRDAILAYGNDTWTFAARALGYQTLQDPLRSVPIPYNILPQVLANGAKQNVYGFDWQLTGEFSNFRHPVLANGERFILYPSISYPMRQSYGFIIPKVGYHYTRYKMDQNTQGFEDATRGLPIASLDSGLYFERGTSWGGKDYLQTLEPRLYYLYVPFKDQSQLPNFTTDEADFNFQRLFTENRFVGGDRIGDANQLTLAVTTRFVESDNGLERLTAGIGQSVYFRSPKVTLGAPLAESKSSDIVGILSSQLTKAASVEAGWQYTPSLTRSEKVVVGGRYAPEPGSVFNAYYKYARQSDDPNDLTHPGIQQVDLSTQWPILRNTTALARWDWSLKDRKIVEGLVGFEYNAGCWQLRAVAHRFITATQTYSTSFQIQLELTGLTRIGINPFETLRQNISGYRRTDEIAQPQSQPQ